MAEILSLKYPSDINEQNGDEDKYANRRVIFMAMNGEPAFEDQKKFYKSTKFSDLSKIQDQEVKAIISLPIPSSLSDTQGHEWSQDSIMGAVSGVANSLMGADKDDTSSGSGGQSSKGLGRFTRYVGSLFKAAETGKDYAMYAVGNRKAMMKPGYFQNYKSSGLRSFSFSFDFVAENEDEAKEIRRIVSAFKTLSSPSSYGAKNESEEANEDVKAESSFWSSAWEALSLTADQIGAMGVMLSPFVWQVIVTNEKVNNMLQLKTCVCTNVTVTYGNDKFDCFADGMPKIINLALSFSEVQLQYAENYARDLTELSNEFNMNPAEFRSTAGKLLGNWNEIKQGAKDLVTTTKKENADAGTEAAKKSLDKNTSTSDKIKAETAQTMAALKEGFTNIGEWVVDHKQFLPLGLGGLTGK